MADVDLQLHPWEYWEAENYPGWWVAVRSPRDPSGAVVCGRVWLEDDGWHGRIAGHRQVTIVGAARLEVAAAVVDGYDGLPVRSEPFA